MVYTETACAKLNLTLDILGQRDDGYHDMRMVMQSIDLRDTVTAEERPQPGVSVGSNLRYLPTDGNNLAAKAAAKYFQTLGRPCPGISFRLDKGIPVCAGMAGGSSDAAAVLRILRRTYSPDLSRDELERIGTLVGSDVPFCVRGGTALAEGRGDYLSDLPPLPPCFLLAVKPPFSISTPELFGLVRGRHLKCHPDTTGLLAALRSGDLEGIAVRLYNVFEEILPRKYTQVFELKSQMLELGAMAASMTGSGPTVFGMFRDRQPALDAFHALRGNYGNVFLCRPVEREKIFPISV